MMAATGAGRKDFGSRAWKWALPWAAPEPSKGTVCPIRSMGRADVHAALGNRAHR